MSTKKYTDSFLANTRGKEVRGKMTEEETIQSYMDKLNLTYDEALELIQWEKKDIDQLTETEKQKKVDYINNKIKEQQEGKPKTKVSEDEIKRLHDKIIELSDKEPFNDWFTSKQLAPHVVDFLGARQIRFRLDKLEEQRIIEVKTTKPKTYKLIN